MLMSDPEDLSPDVGNQEQYEISLDKSTERLVAESPEVVEEDPFNLRRMTKLKQPDLH
jgi:hypothetical protein